MKKLLLLSLMAFTLINVKAQWNKINVSNDVPSNLFTRIVNGNPWIAYCDSALSGVLHLSRWNGNNFSTEIVDDQGGTKNIYASKDKNGIYTIIYNAGIGNNILKYISLKDSVIQTLPTGSDTGEAIKYIHLRYTKANLPVVSYIKGSALYLDTFNGTKWTQSDTIESSNVLTSQFRLDNNDIPYVSYYYENGTDRKIIYAKKNGLVWNKTVISDIYSVGISPKVIVGLSPDNFECVVFPDNDSIKYYKKNSTSWVLSSEFFIGSVKKGTVQNYGIDKKNNLIVMAVYNNDTLHYITYDGTKWTSEPIEPVDMKTVCVSTDADSINKPFVVFREKTTNHVVLAYKQIPVVSNVEEINSHLFTFYPNPVNSVLTIEIQQNTVNGIVTICTISGQVLVTQKISAIKTKIDISNLSNGIYLVKITSDKKTDINKFIKE